MQSSFPFLKSNVIDKYLNAQLVSFMAASSLDLMGFDSLEGVRAMHAFFYTPATGNLVVTDVEEIFTPVTRPRSGKIIEALDSFYSDKRLLAISTFMFLTLSSYAIDNLKRGQLPSDEGTRPAREEGCFVYMTFTTMKMLHGDLLNHTWLLPVDIQPLKVGDSFTLREVGVGKPIPIEAAEGIEYLMSTLKKAAR